MHNTALFIVKGKNETITRRTAFENSKPFCDSACTLSTLTLQKDKGFFYASKCYLKNLQKKCPQFSTWMKKEKDNEKLEIEWISGKWNKKSFCSKGNYPRDRCLHVIISTNMFLWLRERMFIGTKCVGDYMNKMFEYNEICWKHVFVIQSVIKMK